MESSSPHSPQLVHETSHAPEQGHASHLTSIDRFALYKQAHEQLVRQAQLEAKQYAAASKSRTAKKAYGRPPRTSSTTVAKKKTNGKVKKSQRPIEKEAKKALTRQEMQQRRTQRSAVLGLHQASPKPLFSLKFSAEELKTHPRVEDWHLYRQAMKNGILDQEQLPPHFQPLKGTYRFPVGKRKKKSIFNQQELSEEQARDIATKKDRATRLKYLELKGNSAVPLFATRMTLAELQNHSELASWQEHREKVERGELRQEHLPRIFQSTVPGGLIFKKVNSGKSSKPKNTASDENRRYEEQRRETNDKLVKLGLKRNSALPIFARNLTTDEIESHEDFHSWNHYRERMEQGEIIEKDLPDQFKAHKGRLRFNSETDSTSPPSTQATESHKPTGLTSQVRSDSPEWNHFQAQLDSMYDSGNEGNRIDFLR